MSPSLSRNDPEHSISSVGTGRHVRTYSPVRSPVISLFDDQAALPTGWPFTAAGARNSTRVSLPPVSDNVWSEPSSWSSSAMTPNAVPAMPKSNATTAIPFMSFLPRLSWIHPGPEADPIRGTGAIARRRPAPAGAESAQLAERALARILVLAPAEELRSVADPAPAHVVEAHLHDQLRPQRHPLELSVRGPAARIGGPALAGLVRGKLVPQLPFLL